MTPAGREDLPDPATGRLGLLGGTFNPVHWGHLAVAAAAQEARGLDRVVWIPAGDPPHKPDTDLAPQEHRLAMVLLATAGEPGFTVSRLELDRPGPSYTLDTLRHFRRLGFSPDRLFFITGTDAMREFLTWHRPEEVIEQARFLVAERPGCPFASLAEVLPERYLARMERLPAPEMEISSTDIRRRLAAGESVQYLLPEPVAAYIREHGLYGTGS